MDHDSPAHARGAEYPTFGWLKVGVRQEISREVLESMPSGVVDPTVQFDDTTRFALDRMVLDLRAKVLKYDLPGHEVTRQHTVSFDVPNSPWQHWKRKHEGTWWLRWFVQRRPVRTERLSKTVQFGATWVDMATYPWQTVAPTARNLGRPVRFVDLQLKQEEL